jgi:hypothetical protein
MTGKLQFEHSPPIFFEIVSHKTVNTFCITFNTINELTTTSGIVVGYGKKTFMDHSITVMTLWRDESSEMTMFMLNSD